MSLRKMGKFQTENLSYENVMKYYFRIRQSGGVAKLDYHQPEYDSHYTKSGNMYYNRDWLYRRHSLKNKKNLMSQISLF
jgi:hypothetical protein